MNYQDINVRTIDQWIEEGWEWGQPVSHEAYLAALKGRAPIFLTPTKPVPDAWLGDVKGKRVILLDDMVDTAGSLCGAAKALVEIGGATEVYACASHGVLSGPAIQRIEDSVIKEVLFLDTIPAKEGVKCDKIKYLSAAPMLADAISFIYHEDSVSRLFV